MLLTTIHGRRIGLTDEGRLGVLGQPYTVTYSFAAGTSNAVLVTITVRDPEDRAVSAPVNFDLWLSDSSTGAGLTATTASGAVTAALGTIIGTYEAKKAFRVQASITGQFILSITDTAKTGFRIVSQIANARVVSNALTSGNYGL